ncbi:hypothetical protein WMF20_40100 [Sorangium sp. So ce834]|uniref:hypothetical protein n=1 Tax=Sorangium sp. So ce834 TaxID=3133321 RepID=UPI003F60B7B3
MTWIAAKAVKDSKWRTPTGKRSRREAKRALPKLGDALSHGGFPANPVNAKKEIGKRFPKGTLFSDAEWDAFKQLSSTPEGQTWLKASGMLPHDQIEEYLSNDNPEKFRGFHKLHKPSKVVMASYVSRQMNGGEDGKRFEGTPPAAVALSMEARHTTDPARRDELKKQIDQGIAKEWAKTFEHTEPNDDANTAMDKGAVLAPKTVKDTLTRAEPKSLSKDEALDRHRQSIEVLKNTFHLLQAGAEIYDAGSKSHVPLQDVPVAKLLSHGGRVNIQIPAGSPPYALTEFIGITDEKGNPKTGVFKRDYGTHHVALGKRKFKEEGGRVAMVKSKLDDTELYGMNLAIGGLGLKDFNGDVILPDGAHGHLFIGYRPPKPGRPGALQIGLETTGPGAPSTVGYVHNWLSTEKTANPISSVGGLKQDKIGDEKGKNARTVDLRKLGDDWRGTLEDRADQFEQDAKENPTEAIKNLVGPRDIPPPDTEDTAPRAPDASSDGSDDESSDGADDESSDGSDRSERGSRAGDRRDPPGDAASDPKRGAEDPGQSRSDQRQRGAEQAPKGNEPREMPGDAPEQMTAKTPEASSPRPEAGTTQSAPGKAPERPGQPRPERTIVRDLSSEKAASADDPKQLGEGKTSDPADMLAGYNPAASSGDAAADPQAQLDEIEEEPEPPSERAPDPETSTPVEEVTWIVDKAVKNTLWRTDTGMMSRDRAKHGLFAIQGPLGSSGFPPDPATAKERLGRRFPKGPLLSDAEWSAFEQLSSTPQGQSWLNASGMLTHEQIEQYLSDDPSKNPERFRGFHKLHKASKVVLASYVSRQMNGGEAGKRFEGTPPAAVALSMEARHTTDAARREELKRLIDQGIVEEWSKTLEYTEPNDAATEAIDKGAVLAPKTLVNSLTFTKGKQLSKDEVVERHGQSLEVLKNIFHLLQEGAEIYDGTSKSYVPVDDTPVAKLLSHGGRVNVQIPAGSAPYALTEHLGITDKNGKPKPGVFKRFVGTHHVALGDGKFKEQGGQGAALLAKLDDTELYGINLAVGGLGLKDFNGDVILPDGAHGHMFIGYRPPKPGRPGALQIGMETTGPGAPSTVGYVHNWRSTEKTANPISSVGGLKQDKIGDESTKNARTVDLGKLGGDWAKTLKDRAERFEQELAEKGKDALHELLGPRTQPPQELQDAQQRSGGPEQEPRNSERREPPGDASVNMLAGYNPAASSGDATADPEAQFDEIEEEPEPPSERAPDPETSTPVEEVTWIVDKAVKNTLWRPDTGLMSREKAKRGLPTIAAQLTSGGLPRDPGEAKTQIGGRFPKGPLLSDAEWSAFEQLSSTPQGQSWLNASGMLTHDEIEQYLSSDPSDNPERFRGFHQLHKASKVVLASYVSRQMNGGEHGKRFEGTPPAAVALSMEARHTTDSTRREELKRLIDRGIVEEWSKTLEHTEPNDAATEAIDKGAVLDPKKGKKLSKDEVVDRHGQSLEVLKNVFHLLQAGAEIYDGTSKSHVPVDDVPVAKLLSHGGRVNIQIPPGSAPYALTEHLGITDEHGNPAPGVFKRAFGTHHVALGKGKFKEQGGQGAAILAKLDDTELYGINLAVGGLGLKDFNGDVILPDGAHGHLFIGYRPPKPGRPGALQIGLETTGPGAPSTVGYVHNWRSTEKTANPISSVGGLKQDKIGDESTKNARTVDLNKLGNDWATTLKDRADQFEQELAEKGKDALHELLGPRTQPPQELQDDGVGRSGDALAGAAAPGATPSPTPASAGGTAKVEPSAQNSGKTLDELLDELDKQSRAWSQPATDENKKDAIRLLTGLLQRQNVRPSVIDRLRELIQNPASLSQSAFTNCALTGILYPTLKNDLATTSHLVAALFTGKPLGKFADSPAAGSSRPQGSGTGALSDSLDLVRRVMTGDVPQALGPAPTRPLVNGLRTAKAKRDRLKKDTDRAALESHLLDHLLARGLVEMLGPDALAELEQQTDGARQPGVAAAQGDLLASANSVARLFNSALGANATVATGRSPGDYDVARINEALQQTDKAGFAIATVNDGKALWSTAKQHEASSTAPHAPGDVAQRGEPATIALHHAPIDGPIIDQGDSFLVPLQSWGRTFPLRVNKEDMPKVFAAITYGTALPPRAPSPTTSAQVQALAELQAGYNPASSSGDAAADPQAQLDELEEEPEPPSERAPDPETSTPVEEVTWIVDKAVKNTLWRTDTGMMSRDRAKHGLFAIQGPLSSSGFPPDPATAKERLGGRFPKGPLLSDAEWSAFEQLSSTPQGQSWLNASGMLTHEQIEQYLSDDPSKNPERFRGFHKLHKASKVVLASYVSRQMNGGEDGKRFEGTPPAAVALSMEARHTTDAARREELKRLIDQGIVEEWSKTLEYTEPNDAATEAIDKGAVLAPKTLVNSLTFTKGKQLSKDEVVERHGQSLEVLKNVFHLLQEGAEIYDGTSKSYVPVDDTPVAKLLSHGGRVNVQIPAGSAPYALTEHLGITDKNGKPKPGVFKRFVGTHHVALGDGKFKEQGGQGAALLAKLDDTELYGINLAVGGLGLKDFNGDVILPDGAHGHMFIGYRPPKPGRPGALQIGMETTGPGAPSTVGYVHNWRSTEKTANPISSVGGLKQDKIGDESTKNARTVDLGKLGGDWAKTLKDRAERFEQELAEKGKDALHELLGPRTQPPQELQDSQQRSDNEPGDDPADMLAGYNPASSSGDAAADPQAQFDEIEEEPEPPSERAPDPETSTPVEEVTWIVDKAVKNTLWRPDTGIVKRELAKRGLPKLAAQLTSGGLPRDPGEAKTQIGGRFPKGPLLSDAEWSAFEQLSSTPEGRSWLNASGMLTHDEVEQYLSSDPSDNPERFRGFHQLHKASKVVLASYVSRQMNGGEHGKRFEGTPPAAVALSMEARHTTDAARREELKRLIDRGIVEEWSKTLEHTEPNDDASTAIDKGAVLDPKEGKKLSKDEVVDRHGQSLEVLKNVFHLLQAGAEIYDGTSKSHVPVDDVPVAKLLSHGGRVNIQIPPGSAPYALTEHLGITDEHGNPAPGVFKRAFGTHHVALGKGKFKEQGGQGAAILAKLDDTELYGINLAVGGLGLKDFNGDVILPDGAHGHLFIGYRPPKPGRPGALQIGLETTGPGAPSTVGYVHNWRSTEKTANPISSVGGLKQDKIGDESTKNARTVDLGKLGGDWATTLKARADSFEQDLKQRGKDALHELLGPRTQPPQELQDSRQRSDNEPGDAPADMLAGYNPASSSGDAAADPQSQLDEIEEEPPSERAPDPETSTPVEEVTWIVDKAVKNTLWRTDTGMMSRDRAKHGLFAIQGPLGSSGFPPDPATAKERLGGRFPKGPLLSDAEWSAFEQLSSTPQGQSWLNASGMLTHEQIEQYLSDDPSKNPERFRGFHKLHKASKVVLASYVSRQMNGGEAGKRFEGTPPAAVALSMEARHTTDAARREELKRLIDQGIVEEWSKTLEYTEPNDAATEAIGKGAVLAPKTLVNSLTFTKGKQLSKDEVVERHGQSLEVLKNVFHLLQEGAEIYDGTSKSYVPVDDTPVAKLLSHGGRVNVQIPAGSAPYALTEHLGITDKNGKPKPGVFKRFVGTHHVALGDGKFKEQGGQGAALLAKLDDTELYGINLAVGGLGLKDFNGDVILPDGAHGHMFIGYRPPKPGRPGALQIGMETTGPGAPSTVGYVHNWRSTEKTANPISSVGGLKQDKIGDESTKNARTVDLGKLGGDWAKTLKDRADSFEQDLKQRGKDALHELLGPRTQPPQELQDGQQRSDNEPGDAPTDTAQRPKAPASVLAGYNPTLDGENVAADARPHADSAQVEPSSQRQGRTLDELVSSLEEQSRAWSGPANDKVRQQAANSLAGLLESLNVDRAIVNRLRELIENPASLSQSAFSSCGLSSALYTMLKGDLATTSHLVVALFTGRLLGRLAQAPGARELGAQPDPGRAVLSEDLDILRRVMTGEIPRALGPAPTRPLVNGLKTAGAKRGGLTKATDRQQLDRHLLDHLLSRGLVELLGQDAVAQHGERTDGAKQPGVAAAQGDMLLSASSIASLMSDALGAEVTVKSGGLSEGDVTRINETLGRTDRSGFAVATIANGKALWEAAKRHRDGGDAKPHAPATVAPLRKGEAESRHHFAIDGEITVDGDAFIVPVQSWGQSFPIRVPKADMPRLFEVVTLGTYPPPRAPAPGTSAEQRAPAHRASREPSGTAHDGADTADLLAGAPVKQDGASLDPGSVQRNSSGLYRALQERVPQQHLNEVERLVDDTIGARLLPQLLDILPIELPAAKRLAEEIVEKWLLFHPGVGRLPPGELQQQLAAHVKLVVRTLKRDQGRRTISRGNDADKDGKAPPAAAEPRAPQHAPPPDPQKHEKKQRKPQKQGNFKKPARNTPAEQSIPDWIWGMPQYKGLQDKLLERFTDDTVQRALSELLAQESLSLNSFALFLSAKDSSRESKNALKWFKKVLEPYTGEKRRLAFDVAKALGALDSLEKMPGVDLPALRDPPPPPTRDEEAPQAVAKRGKEGRWVTSDELKIVERSIGQRAFAGMLARAMDKGKVANTRGIIEHLVRHAERLSDPALSPPLTSTSLVVDSNLVEDLLTPRDQLSPARRDIRDQLESLIRKEKITDLRLANINIGELFQHDDILGSTFTTSDGTTTIPWYGIRRDRGQRGDIDEYDQGFDELTKKSVGEKKGSADRSMLADAFFSERASEGGATAVPHFATNDNGILTPLLDFAGIDAAKRGEKPFDKFVEENSGGTSYFRPRLMDRELKTHAILAQKRSPNTTTDGAAPDPSPPIGASLLDTPVGATHHVHDLIALINTYGFDVYIVGGAVRDALSGIEPRDVDLKTNMPMWMLEEALQSHPSLRFLSVSTVPNLRLLQVGSGDNVVDITAGDSASALVPFDVMADAQKRDFRMNAIYVDENGFVVDPIGGIEDQLLGRLRFVADPGPPASVEDRQSAVVEHLRQAPWNLGRALKFYQRGYALDPEILHALLDNAESILASMKEREAPLRDKSLLLHQMRVKSPDQLIETMEVLGFSPGAIRELIPDEVAGRFDDESLAYEHDILPRWRDTPDDDARDYPLGAPEMKIDIATGRIYQYRFHALLPPQQPGHAEERVIIDVDLSDHNQAGHNAPHYHVYRWRDRGGKATWDKKKNGFSDTGQPGYPPIDGDYYRGPQPWRFDEELHSNSSDFVPAAEKLIEDAGIEFTMTGDQIELGGQVKLHRERLRELHGRGQLGKLLMLVKNLNDGIPWSSKDQATVDLSGSQRGQERLRFRPQLDLVVPFLIDAGIKDPSSVELFAENGQMRHDALLRLYDLVSGEARPDLRRPAAEFALDGAKSFNEFVERFEFYVASMQDNLSGADVDALWQAQLQAAQEAGAVGDTTLGEGGNLQERLAAAADQLQFESTSTAAYHSAKHAADFLAPAELEAVSQADVVRRYLDAARDVVRNATAIETRTDETGATNVVLWHGANKAIARVRPDGTAHLLTSYAHDRRNIAPAAVSPPPAETGVHNIGNSCFLSAGLTMLALTDAYYDLFAPRDGEDLDAAGPRLRAAVRPILEQIRAGTLVGAETMQALDEVLRDTGVLGASSRTTQQDPSEVLFRRLFERASLDTAGVTLAQRQRTDWREVKLSETGEALGDRTSLDDNLVWDSTQPDVVLSPLVNGSRTLQQALDAHFGASTMDDVAAVRQGRAVTGSPSRQLLVDSTNNTPRAITIALQRGDGENESEIDVPEWLRVNDRWYRLNVVVNHHGPTRDAGHYTATTRNAATGQWQVRDDRRVSDADPRAAAQRRNRGYLFTFERVDDAADGPDAAAEATAARIVGTALAPLPSTPSSSAATNGATRPEGEDPADQLGSFSPWNGASDATQGPRAPQATDAPAALDAVTIPAPIDALVRTLVAKSGAWSSPRTQADKQEAIALVTELLQQLGMDAKVVDRGGEQGKDSPDSEHSTCTCVR